MQAQGISFISPNGDVAISTKTAKKKDDTFDCLMSKSEEKISVADKKVQNKSEKKEDSFSLRKEDANPLTKESVHSGKKQIQEKEDVAELVDVPEMAAQTMLLLQNTLGLTQEELTDIMEQLGMQIQDVMFGNQDGIVTLLNTEAIQQLVMEVHGVEDAAAVLTNDLLSQQITDITEQLAWLLKDGFLPDDAGTKDLATALPKELAEQLDALLKAQENQSEDAIDSDLTMADNRTNVSLETLEDMSQSDEGAADMLSQSMSEMSRQETEQTLADSSQTMPFTEKLAQALEKTDMAQTVTTEQTMTHIVEQVVRQVRIRVMPETTSMELQLNPASLGRVNITVASSVGVTTATMLVENEIAKEALESQLITLKETFAEQGLKVDEVEVAVGNFNLKKENEQQDEPASRKKQNRRIQLSENVMAEEEENADVRMTASERREVDSTIDYTA